VEVLAVKKFFRSFFDPTSSRGKAALRAVPIATRVVSLLCKFATVALQAVATKNARTAILNRLNHFIILHGHFPEQVIMLNEDVGDFKRGFRIAHGSTSKTKSSSGLSTLIFLMSAM